MRPVHDSSSLSLVPAPSACSDDPAAWVAGVQRGDQTSAEKLWTKYNALVYHVIRRLLGPDEEVSDLVQETFLLFFSKLAHLQDIRALTSFLRGIAVKVAQNELRRRKRHSWIRLTPTGLLDDPPSEPADYEKKEAVRRFFAMLNRLDVDSRTVFILRHVEHHELLEIAEFVSLSRSTVLRRLQHAEKLLSLYVSRDESLTSYVSRTSSWMDSEGDQTP